MLTCAREDDTATSLASDAGCVGDGSAVDTVAVGSATATVLELLGGIQALVAAAKRLRDGAGRESVRAEFSVLLDASTSMSEDSGGRGGSEELH